jgi:hypothetical protein
MEWSVEQSGLVAMQEDWPFVDPPNVVALTLRQIIAGEKPILLVCHDAEDGMWQFLDGNDVRMEDALLVCLKNVAECDPSVRELADLPLGWQAIRTRPGQVWRRCQPEGH